MAPMRSVAAVATSGEPVHVVWPPPEPGSSRDMGSTANTIPAPHGLALSRWAAARSLRPITVPRRGRVVVVAPHPDDETLGAGGTMHDLAALGFSVSIVIVTDGAASHEGIADLAETRRDEACRAAAELGLAERPCFLDVPDGHVSDHREALATRLRGMIDGCELVIAPRAGDGHPDHEATAEAVVEAVMGMPDDRRPHVWRYAIWAWEWDGVRQGDLDGAAVWKVSRPGRIRRSQAVAAYRSQIAAEVIVPAAMIADIESADEVFWC